MAANSLRDVTISALRKEWVNQPSASASVMRSGSSSLSSVSTRS